MRKGSYFAASFWDSPIWRALKGLSGDHLRVYLHLAHGPNSEVSGLYRISIGQIAEDTDLDPDHVRGIIDDFVSIGWCDFEPPVLWIRGEGNINDQLGTRDFKRNALWVKSTERHIERLPPNRVVRAFCEFHRLALSHEPPAPSGASTPPAVEGIAHRDKEGISIPYRGGTDTLSIPYPEGTDTLPIPYRGGTDTLSIPSTQAPWRGATTCGEPVYDELDTGGLA